MTKIDKPAAYVAAAEQSATEQSRQGGHAMDLKTAAYTKGAKRRKRKARISLPPTNIGGICTAMPTAWDGGASGPANQIGLRVESATDIDPESGKETPNPNGIKRRRRDDWITRYFRSGHISAKQAADAVKLRMASEGMRERDPLAALSGVAGGRCDIEAARVDARKYFRQLWAMVPASSRPVVERVILDDQPIWHGNQGMRDRHFARLVAGLDAIGGE